MPTRVGERVSDPYCLLPNHPVHPCCAATILARPRVYRSRRALRNVTLRTGRHWRVRPIRRHAINSGGMGGGRVVRHRRDHAGRCGNARRYECATRRNVDPNGTSIRRHR